MSHRTRNAHRNLDVLFGRTPLVVWATAWAFLILRALPQWCAP